MRLGLPTSKTRFLWRLSPFDIIWAIATPFIALALRDPTLLDPEGFENGFPHGYQFALLTVAYAIPAFLFFRLRDGLSRYFSVDDVWAVAGATGAIVSASGVTLFVVNRMDGVPRSTPLIYGLVLAAGLLGGRAIARMSRKERIVDAQTTVAAHLRRVVLVGVDRFSAIAISLTACQHPRTTHVVAALDPRSRLGGRAVHGVKIIGRPRDIDAVIEEYFVHGVEIDEVWLADGALSPEEKALVEDRCRGLGVRARAVSEALNLTPLREPIFSDQGTRTIAPHLGYFRVKRAIDAIVAAILLVLVAPLALVVAILTYIDVGDPIIFWQRRIGQNGREFLLFKFRTYQAPYGKNGEQIDGEVRLSRLGKAIRATRFDEFPQLLNILRGDMSLIGPRPLLPRDQPEDPSSRLLVRPGVTGWAQVLGGVLVTPEEKDALDVWYIHHASPMLDVRIVARTLKVVILGDRKHDDEIAAARKWYENLRQIDQRAFGDPAPMNPPPAH